MNCESISLLMNAALDGELPADQRSTLESHLSDCAACRRQYSEMQTLHRDLGEILKLPMQQAVDNLMQRIASRPCAEGPLGTGIPVLVPHQILRSRSALLVLTVCSCALLLAIATVLNWPLATPAIAEIEISTGTIDVKHAEARNWIPVQQTGRVALSPRARIRTRSGSLCEIRTGCDAIVRLNQDSELVVHRPEKVELVSGELWCRAPASKGLEICGPESLNQKQVPLFTCPSSSEMQWRTTPDQVMSCVDLSATPLEIGIQSASCTIQPGESISFLSGMPDSKGTQRIDTLLETSWQIPLLASRNPRSVELRQRLTSMLELIGEAKAAYLYEDQIRQLGPSGAIPLLAFVRSPESREHPMIRIRAMQYATELATSTSLSEIRSLQDDPDSEIRQMALLAVQRLSAKE